VTDGRSVIDACDLARYDARLTVVPSSPRQDRSGTPKCRHSKTPTLENTGTRKNRQSQKPAIAERSNTMNRMLLTALIVGSVGIAGTAQAAGDAAAGKAKATSCAMCHGPNGEGTQMAGKIAGMAPAAFIQAMDDYKSGKRDNAMMKSQASALSADDTANLAAYYASLK
jgi:cytochrome c553